MPRRDAGQDAVGGELNRPDQRNDHLRAEGAAARVESKRHPAKAGRDRQPSPPADTFPQKRHRQRRDHQRIAGEDHLVADKPDNSEAIDGGADLRDEKDAARGLEPGPDGYRGASDAAWPGRAEGQHEQREEPEPDGDDRDQAIGLGKKP